MQGTLWRIVSVLTIKITEKLNIVEARMDDIDFEGTLVLEKLAEIGKIDAFFEAIDSDNFVKIRQLMKQAQIDEETIFIVMKKIQDGENE